jgi:hypothetical protein
MLQVALDQSTVLSAFLQSTELQLLLLLLLLLLCLCAAGVRG